MLYNKYPVVYNDKDYTVNIIRKFLFDSKIVWEVMLYNGKEKWYSCSIFNRVFEDNHHKSESFFLDIVKQTFEEYEKKLNELRVGRESVENFIEWDGNLDSIPIGNQKNKIDIDYCNSLLNQLEVCVSNSANEHFIIVREDIPIFQKSLKELVKSSKPFHH